MIHGYQVLCEPIDDPKSDGFASTVKGKDGTIRGPFKTVADAIRAAHAWNAKDGSNARAALKAVEDAAEVCDNHAASEASKNQESAAQDTEVTSETK